VVSEFPILKQGLVKMNLDYVYYVDQKGKVWFIDHGEESPYFYRWFISYKFKDVLKMFNMDLFINYVLNEYGIDLNDKKLHQQKYLFAAM